MKVIAIINQKGGAGKTTTALALGAGLSIKGLNVLFTDLDAQGNLSCTLGAETTGPSGQDVFNMLMGNARPEEATQRMEQSAAAASSPALAGADIALSELGKEYRLKEALAPLHAVA